MNEDIETKSTILVIDDETDMLALVKRILEPEGFNVMLAADGVFGLSIVRQENPDLILLDIMMPGPDGIEVLKRIRESSGAPVIMVTAKRDSVSLQKALDSGADDYITKPFRPGELAARVKAKLRRA